MIRGINTLERSFNVLTEKQKTMANNAANVTTPGYKSQQLVQSTLESRAIHNYMDGPNLNQRMETDEWIFGNQLDEAYRNFSDGSLQGTGMTTDLALQGNGFFTVQSADGETYYTRNGNFTVNDDGLLSTQEGHLVLGIQQGGGSEFINAGSGFSVDARGFVTVNGEAGQQYLYITQFDDPNTLTSVGDNLFQGDGGVPAAGDFLVTQGFVENSTGDMVDIMSDMLQITREFEANQRALQAIDETLRRATTEVGRV